MIVILKCYPYYLCILHCHVGEVVEFSWHPPGSKARQGGMLIFGKATLVNCIVSLEGKRKEKKKQNPNDHKWED